MNYNRIYLQLIDRAKNRVLEGYIEKHHIIPTCFGGTDNKSNLVDLTAREHFIAHLLLYKCQTTKRRKYQMLKACIMMGGKEKYNSKLYEGARIEYSKIHSERMSGANHPMYDVHRYGEQNPFYGKKHTQHIKDLLSSQRTDMVVAKDKHTNVKVCVTKEEFESNDDLVGHTKGYDSKYKCTIAVHKNKTIYINPDDLYKYIEDGYKLGEVPKTKKPCVFCGIEITNQNMQRHIKSKHEKEKI